MKHPLCSESHYQFEKVCLASQSPRRRELLSQIGAAFDVMPADIDERQLANEAPTDYVERITKAKATAIWQAPDYHQSVPVLASDTAVINGHSILGKPVDKADGVAMLKALSGRTHWVLSGVALVWQQECYYRLSKNQVTFSELTDELIERYWQTGEGHDKAGCYAVQGMAASFIENIEGSFSAIMGLPLLETTQLLVAAGVKCWPSKAD
ncbi:nucleoside triphosphate pyrophosphatase [Pleionea sp. CnH1-48]|uniref:Maf family protein n=1 Tax=Pleionea sp. CnH1-48 TaxID=2954494 RepID=UPI0020980E4A|nr:Maf family protein [Pleionea sp. CnH1-48]MCO7224059.1 Maf family nucleotide pyrophosphatase [Pleionea sp. CnH1-48]